ncbi:DUF1800 domain-containing protein [Aquincola sp. S2]|uniref:DUF1800 domain-containing protein n=1 Tax=Pseudaquabacterium terrae TaxID=2732868 RepID=A0ABX2ELY5_9BURK|nr:DUF1800 domain-containing protein [Aquabacterium terrae]NRF69635.1 DUF1800 domain-containing protein [Aquabacterium terrae]
MRKNVRTSTRWAAALLALGLTGCGGGQEDAAPQQAAQTAPQQAANQTALAAPGPGTAAPAPAAAPSVAEAHRLLTQASFGPTEAAIADVQARGSAGWIDHQFTLGTPGTMRAYWEAADAAIQAVDPNRRAGSTEVYNGFWKQSLSAPDQLRQRVAFALSEIFVVSLDGAPNSNPRAVAAWYDMLGAHAFGNYRQLLEAVSLHPMMGVYLSHLHNQKADPQTGRVPDENFAREVMQLFSIGLVRLNVDGTMPRDSAGQPLPTYTGADIAGMAKVFTGWSWACPDAPHKNCFLYGQANGRSDPDRGFKPMVAYPQYHSTEEKRFLGAVVPAQSTPNPQASLNVALDTLFHHPNVGPFIARQLIQRLVTSNPSRAYIRSVAAAFANNGANVRGDMKAVVRAVLLHPEARNAPTSLTQGKLREPVLRLTALLRGFGYSSDSGLYRLGDTSNPGAALGQQALKSPSVFNFFRPGYVPPGTLAAAQGLTVPEMQLLHETTAAGYVNTLRNAIGSGLGSWNATLQRADLQPDFGAELALATQPPALVDRVALKLMGGAMPQPLRTEIVNAVAAITIPTPNAGNATQVERAKRNRVNAAVLLTAASPEFQIQK